MRLKLKLTVASIKMFFRQKEAIIWTFLFPTLIITLLGFVRFDSMGTLDIGIVNESGENGDRFVRLLKEVTTIRVHQGKKEIELGWLEKGERELVVMLPAGFQQDSGGVLTTFVNDGRPQQVQMGMFVLQRIADEAAFRRFEIPGRVVFKPEPVKSRNLTYLDFLLPGVLSLSIMQMGIFGVAFGFVSLKKRGILRRLWVTPINPNDFILAQVATRLLIVLIQIVLIVSIGILAFHLHFTGSLWDMFVVGSLGGVVFLAMGFTIAGISKSEDQVAPFSNIVALPMMFLSGVFFGRGALPDVVRTITGFLPLTYLTDAMRSIAIDGAGLLQVGPQLAGLTVWCVIACFVAIKMFRWE